MSELPVTFRVSTAPISPEMERHQRALERVVNTLMRAHFQRLEVDTVDAAFSGPGVSARPVFFLGPRTVPPRCASRSLLPLDRSPPKSSQSGDHPMGSKTQETT